jgi:hypothetical protein
MKRAQCECEATAKRREKTVLPRAHVGRCPEDADVEVTRDGKRVKLCGDCTFPSDTDRKDLEP